MTFAISHTRQRQLDDVDMMPGPLRACVHEFGLPIVNACLTMGVRDPRHIRQLVHEVWNGARQNSQRQMGLGASKVMKQLDWLLLQSGSAVSAATLVGVLWRSGLLIVPRDPSGAMLDASMAEVSGGNEPMTKREKHRRRLRAAMDAAARRLWPHLFTEAAE